jgi:hypothetical protein
LVGVVFGFEVEVLLGSAVEFGFAVVVRVGEVLAVAVRMDNFVGVLVGVRKIGSDAAPAGRSCNALTRNTISVATGAAIPLAMLGAARDIR